ADLAQGGLGPDSPDGRLGQLPWIVCCGAGPLGTGAGRTSFGPARLAVVPTARRHPGPPAGRLLCRLCRADCAVQPARAVSVLAHLADGPTPQCPGHGRVATAATEAQFGRPLVLLRNLGRGPPARRADAAALPHRQTLAD